MTRARFFGPLLPALGLALGLLAPCAPAWADVYDAAFDKANQAYFAGDYAGARVAYEEIDRQGVAAPDLYYNLGVTYHRLGEHGRAVWCFERALALNHDDGDAAFNLAQVRKQLGRGATDRLEGAEKDAAWIRLVNALSPSTETWLFIAFYMLTFAILVFRMRVHRDSRTPYTAGAALAGVAAGLFGLLLVGRMALDRIPFVVVLPESVAVKEGADVNYRTAFDVHAGLRVRLLERDEAWLRVRLANGLEGWVRQDDVGRL